MRAPSVGWSPSWQGAVDEALRLHQVATSKWPDLVPGQFVYRVRKRRGSRTGHYVWRIYTPTGDIPHV